MKWTNLIWALAVAVMVTWTLDTNAEAASVDSVISLSEAAVEDDAAIEDNQDAAADSEAEAAEEPADDATASDDSQSSDEATADASESNEAH